MTNPSDEAQKAPENHRRPLHHRIDTERFWLENLTPEHADRVSAWRGLDRVQTALAESAPKWSVEQWAAYIGSFDHVKNHMFGIFERASGQPVGFYTLEISPKHNTGSITLVIGADGALRQAVAIETARALTDWAFDIRGLDKLTAKVASHNQITKDWLATRMTLEGTLRDQIRRADGSREDVLLYGLLKREWPAMRAWSIENQTLRHSPGSEQGGS